MGCRVVMTVGGQKDGQTSLTTTKYCVYGRLKVKWLSIFIYRAQLKSTSPPHGKYAMMPLSSTSTATELTVQQYLLTQPEMILVHCITPIQYACGLNTSGHRYILVSWRQETNPKLITNNMKKVLRIHSSNLSHTNVTQYIEGILSKGPYLPCLRMADRALLAGYPGYLMVNLYVSQYLCTQIRTVYLYRSVFTAHYISTGLIPITPWPLSVAFEVWCEYMSDFSPGHSAMD